MSLRNHGPIQLFVTDTYVDVITPFGFDVLKQAIRKLGGKWVPDRKVFRILPASPQAVQGAVETLESELKASSPEGFVNALTRIGNLVCVSTRYEIRVGLSGIHFTVPKNEPVDYELRKFTQAKFHERYDVPPDKCSDPVIKSVMTRIVTEDQKIVMRVAEPYSERAFRGHYEASQDELEGFRLVQGMIAFAPSTFLAKADPKAEGKRVKLLPFRVASVVPDGPSGYAVDLRIVEPKKAWDVARQWIASGKLESGVLDAARVPREWVRMPV